MQEALEARMIPFCGSVSDEHVISGVQSPISVHGLRPELLVNISLESNLL